MKPLHTLKAELLANPATRAEYDALAPEFEPAGELVVAVDAERTDPRIAELLDLIGEAYQVVGVLACDCGRFDDPAVVKVLDNLAAARMVHADALPFPSKPDA